MCGRKGSAAPQDSKHRYSMFALLYFAQGAILSYFTVLNALYLRSFELSMSEIGLFSAIALTPFVLDFSGPPYADTPLVMAEE